MVRVSVVVCVAALLAASCSTDPEVAKREHLEKGDRYVAEQKFPEATIEYRNAIVADPRFGEARLKLGDAYMKANQPANALPEYVRAADLLPDNSDAQLKAGNLLLLAGKFEDAKARADKALAVTPRSVDAQLMKGTALAGLRDLDAAMKEVEAAIQDDPARADAYSSLAILQQAKGDNVEAEATFKRAVESDPKSVNAHLALANFYGMTGRLKEAQGSIETALAIDPTNVRANRAHSIVLIVSGRWRDAEKPLKVIADTTPGPSGKIALADYYVAAGRAADAKSLLESLTDSEPGGNQAKVRLASLALGSGDRPQAERLIDDVLKKNPREVQALLFRVELQLRDRQLDAALATARSAVDIDPQLVKSHYTLGRVLAMLGHDADATKSYQEALRLQPSHAGAAMELARLELNRNRRSEALQFAQTAVRFAPRNPEALLVLARSQMAVGDNISAESTLNLLNKSYADAPQVQAETGRLLAIRGDYVRARAAFERALTTQPDNLSALEGLIAISIQEKRPVDARPRVETAINKAPTSDEVQLMAGRYYDTLKEDGPAEKALKQAVALNSNNMRAFTALAQFYAARQRVDDATTEFERLVSAQPGNATALTILGMLLEMQNRSADARGFYQKAVAAEPRAVVAANNLAWIYADAGDQLDTALQLAQTAKAALPNSHEVSDTLGWVYYKKGLIGHALAPLRDSAEKEPNNPIYQFHLGLALAKAGDLKNARLALERALELKLPAQHVDEAKRVLATVS